MLTIAIAAAAIGFTGSFPPVYCPVTLEKVETPAITMVYNGATFGTCCGQCDGPFASDPKGLIAKAIQAKKTVGVFQYDPVTGIRITADKAEAFSDYKAIRYFFGEAAEKKSFDVSPAKYIPPVKSEAYYCPIMDQATTPEEAQSFGDYKGVRYYMCCTICVKKLRQHKVGYLAKAAAAAKPLAVITLKK